MHFIKLKITAEAPVLIATSSGERNTVSTSGCITGTTILGMYASRYIQKEKISDAHTDETFRKWFLEGGLLFANAYINGKKENGSEYEALPFPRTVKKHKYEKKYFNDLDEETEDTKPAEGYGIISENIIHRKEVKKSLNFHHERDPKTGSSVKGMIFNYESLDGNQTFTGYITGEESDLKKFKETFSGETEFFAGRSRNSQYGKIKIETGEVSPFDKYYKDAARQCENGNLIITLISDTIIYNDYGFSVTDVEKIVKIFQVCTGNTNINIKKANASQTIAENYVAIWKLKKPSETCFKAGTVLILEGLKNGDFDKIKKLEETGIGERRNEGFGRFLAGYYSGKISNFESKSDIINKPEGVIPDEFKNILSKIAEKRAESFLKNNAISLSKKLEGLNTSLISRLLQIFSVCNNKTEFNSKLDNLRKPAKEKLGTYINFRNEHIKIIDFLKNIKENDYVQVKAIGDYGKNFSEDDKNKFYKLFMTVLFSNARLNAKKKEKEGGNQNVER